MLSHRRKGRREIAFPASGQHFQALPKSFGKLVSKLETYKPFVCPVT
jgi:hypothetical protein